MPGKQVKNWKIYHGLRKHGASKSKAARIANWHAAGRPSRRRTGARRRGR